MILIINKLETMVEVSDMYPLRSKHKAITTLFSYATHMDQGEQRKMVDAIFHAVKASELIIKWHPVKAHIAALFDESSPPSSNYAIALMTPFIYRSFVWTLETVLQQHWQSRIQWKSARAWFIGCCTFYPVTPCGCPFRSAFGRG